MATFSRTHPTTTSQPLWTGPADTGFRFLMMLGPSLVNAVCVGLAARVPYALIFACFGSALTAALIGTLVEPIVGVAYNRSGLVFRRWNGRVRHVAWNELKCISVQLGEPRIPVLVFHVGHHSREDRFALILLSTILGGRSPQSLMKELAAHAPPLATIEIRRGSWRTVAVGLAWMLSTAFVGLCVAVAMGTVDLASLLIAQGVGAGVLVGVLSAGKRPPVSAAAGKAPPERIPKAYQDWLTAIVQSRKESAELG
jgi:hypothetical protein